MDEQAELEPNRARTVRDQVHVVISFRGSQHRLVLPAATTLDELQARIAHAFPPQHLPPAHQRLVLKGKRLDNHAGRVSVNEILPASATDPDRPAKILLVATSAEGAEHVKGAAEREREARQLNREREVVDELASPVSGSLSLGSRDTLHGRRGHPEYRFHAIRELPGLPHREQARAILEELAADPGIAAVMLKHRWSVGCLSEMYPEGNVGVDEVCVLGLNKNKGQEILLRLRTDDLSGFRKPLNIKKVLYHELTHNQFSEHDSDFWAMCRQVERECNLLDYRNSANTLGGTFRPPLAQQQQQQQAQLTGGVGRLGGGQHDESWRTAEPASMAASAATLRLTAEEQELERTCNASQALDRQRSEDVCPCCRVPRSAPPFDCEVCSSATPAAAQQPQTTEPPTVTPTEASAAATPDSVLDAADVDMPDAASENPWAHVLAPAPASAPTPPPASATTSAPAPTPTPRSPTAAPDHVVTAALSSLVDFGFDAYIAQAALAHCAGDRETALELLLAGGPIVAAPPPSGREERVSASAARLGAQLPATAKAIDKLAAVLRQVQHDPKQPRWRSINTQSKTFTRDLSNPAALDFLDAVGFEKQQDGSLFLKRDDPGLLWLGLSALETSRQAESGRRTAEK